eukprot:9795628-Alexandrium_andersonii.AAC.1
MGRALPGPRSSPSATANHGRAEPGRGCPVGAPGQCRHSPTGPCSSRYSGPEPSKGGCNCRGHVRRPREGTRTNAGCPCRTTPRRPDGGRAGAPRMAQRVPAALPPERRPRQGPLCAGGRGCLLYTSDAADDM